MILVSFLYQSLLLNPRPTVRLKVSVHVLHTGAASASHVAWVAQRGVCCTHSGGQLLLIVVVMVCASQARPPPALTESFVFLGPPDSSQS